MISIFALESYIEIDYVQLYKENMGKPSRVVMNPRSNEVCMVGVLEPGQSEFRVNRPWSNRY